MTGHLERRESPQANFMDGEGEEERKLRVQSSKKELDNQRRGTGERAG